MNETKTTIYKHIVGKKSGTVHICKLSCNVTKGNVFIGQKKEGDKDGC